MVSADPELPELGPWLGRLPEVVRRDSDVDLALDPIRWDLVSRLFERADAARGFLVAGDAEGARAALDRAAWFDVWSPAADRVTAQVMIVMDARLERAALSSGAPARHGRAARATEDERAVIRAKLNAAAIPLERAGGPSPPRGADWPPHVRRMCHALEAAWDELEQTARHEVAARDAAVRRVAAWQPPKELWIGGLVGLGALAAWLGLALGGYVPLPSSLTAFAAWFWALPWP